MRARVALALGLLVAALLLSACAAPLDDAAPLPRTARTPDGLHELELLLPAGGLPFNEPFELEVVLRRTDGAPLGDDVELLPSGWMPEHGHGMVRFPRAERLAGGRFRTHGWLLHMSGLWELRFDVLSGAGRVRGNELTRAVVEVRLP